jgi:hypothetical protein
MATFKLTAEPGVKLYDPQWPSVPANATLAYGAIAAGKMPPDKPWPPDRLSLFKAWMDAGYLA